MPGVEVAVLLVSPSLSKCRLLGRRLLRIKILVDVATKGHVDPN